MSLLYSDPNLEIIWEKLAHGERLNSEDGVRLYRSNDIVTLGQLALEAKEKQFGKTVYFSNNLYINPTNICDVGCYFCAFARPEDAPDAYVISLEEIGQRVREAVERFNVHEVHIVGGLYEKLSFDYFAGIVSVIKEASPSLFVKAFTAVEIDFLAKMGKMSIRECLLELKRRGLDSLPGGGAEILGERVRKKICPQKITGKEWIDIHREAHEVGLVTNATMLYGHVEGPEDRVEHMIMIRDLQDETGGFRSFVPLAFHPKNTKLDHISPTDGMLDLKNFAVARLLMDNVPHIKAYWTTLGMKMAQVSLYFGVDDFAGTNINEKIMHDAGASSPVETTRKEIVRLIKEAGFEPCEVDSSYSTQYA
ncbi:MAG: aminofutalosine synthase MqnE [Candidatus Omnitrophica bacterium]|nr:aminofutalosine synthase MqnE [Candidatus Omnitrophota bacterium]